jgi:hypothetical protein
LLSYIVYYIPPSFAFLYRQYCCSLP